MLYLKKLFITLKSFDTAMVSSPSNFYQKPNQQRTGLHHTALQYLTEIAENYIQICGSKNISSQLHNLRRFTNVSKYELHNKYGRSSK